MRILAADTQLITSGCEPYELGTAWCWYSKANGVYDTSRVNTTVIDKACSMSVNDKSPFVMDIEAFDLTTEHGKAMAELSRAAMRWRTNQPYRQIGFYCIIPERDYWSPVGRNDAVRRGSVSLCRKYDPRVRSWRGLNDKTANTLLHLVDFLCVSVYEFYENKQAEWRVYGDAMLSEASRVAQGKPIYAMLMPCFHDTTKPLSLDQWTQMLEFVSWRNDVAGIMIHSSPTYAVSEGWRDPVIKLARQSTPTP